jgi:hypothetical protein
MYDYFIGYRDISGEVFEMNGDFRKLFHIHTQPCYQIAEGLFMCQCGINLMRDPPQGFCQLRDFGF